MNVFCNKYNRLQNLLLILWLQSFINVDLTISCFLVSNENHAKLFENKKKMIKVTTIIFTHLVLKKNVIYNEHYLFSKTDKNVPHSKHSIMNKGVKLNTNGTSNAQAYIQFLFSMHQTIFFIFFSRNVVIIFFDFL